MKSFLTAVTVEYKHTILNDESISKRNIYGIKHNYEHIY